MDILSYMKLKTISVSALVFAASSFLLASPAMAYCEVNGSEVPCDQFFTDYGWIVAAVFGTMAILVVGMLFFWCWMVIDCLQRNFPNKIIWLLGFFVFGLPTAIIYFFVIKKAAPATGPFGSSIPDTSADPNVSPYNPPKTPSNIS